MAGGNKKTIIVLGAGIASISIIRQLMRQTVLPSNDWKLVVVAPNTHLHYPVAMPRVLVPGQMADDAVFVPLDLQFRQYADVPDKFEFVLSAAEALDPDARTVTVSGGTRTLRYDTLVIATGSSSADGLPWKTLGSTDETRAVADRLRRAIASAKTIVVAGGGPTGTEMAGELASEYAGTKKIIFVYSGARPLDPAGIPSVQEAARAQLESAKVQLVPNTTVTGSTVDPDTGAATLQLSTNGKTSTLEADVYLPSMGLRPNTAFAPKSMLDDRGQIKQTIGLQAEGYPDIYVAGDVGSLEPSKLTIAAVQSLHLSRHLPPLLSEGTAMPAYQLDTRDVLGVTLGRSKGTGQFKGWKIPGFFVWLAKRRLFIDSFDGLVMGTRAWDVALEK